MARRFGYAGAVGKATLAQLARLAARGYLAQPKYDGVYLTVTTDGAGEVANVITRAGKQPAQAVAAFRGVYLGAPNSTFHAEAELQTEAANAVATARGYRCLYLFDCTRLTGDDLSGSPYRIRHAWLERMQAHIRGERADRSPTDASGRFHDALGRFIPEPTPTAHRRWSVAPLVSLDAFDTAWTQWVDRGEAGPCEGMVLIHPEAKLGQRSAKLKLKPSDTVDAIVLDASPTRAVVRSLAGMFTVGCAGYPLTAGQAIAVRHEGFYASGLPRFPRIDRVRPDLA